MNKIKQIFNPIKKILNITGKIFLVFAVFVFIINLFIIFSPNNREKIDFDKVTQQNREAIYKNINDKKINSSNEGKQAIALYRLANCLFIGEACTENPEDGEVNYENSVFGFMAKGITLPYFNQPASGAYWVYDTLRNNNLVSETYAAEGIGFSAIQPLSGLWKIFRNASFLILVTILVAIGFMIMFRVKINPQTIISLENSLPRIVVTLLLITFSFPIAGFMIDLMYILMALGITLFGGYIDLSSNLPNILTGNSSKLWDKIFLNGDIWLVGSALLEILPAAFGEILRGIIVVISLFIIERFTIGKNVTGGILKQIGAFFGNIFEFGLNTVMYAVIGTFIYQIVPLILSFVVLLSALVVFFRIFFLLFKSYIKIILLVIFSPLILLFDAIPGRKMFLLWLKNMMSNLIAFPIVSTLIILSAVISSLNNAEKLWTPPFLYTNQAQSILILVSVGILFMIPDIVKAVRGALGIKESALATGAGVFFGGATAAAGTAFAPLQKLGSFAYGFTSIQNTKIGEKLFGKRK